MKKKFKQLGFYASIIYPICAYFIQKLFTSLLILVVIFLVNIRLDILFKKVSSKKPKRHNPRTKVPVEQTPSMAM